MVSPTSAVLLRAVMILTTPFGIPARSASSARAAAVSGVSPGDFTTTVQPAASAGPIFRVIIAAGKFHLHHIVSIPVLFEIVGGMTYGVINPQTPTGSLIVNTLFPGMLAPMVSP